MYRLGWRTVLYGTDRSRPTRVPGYQTSSRGSTRGLHRCRHTGGSVFSMTLHWSKLLVLTQTLYYTGDNLEKNFSLSFMCHPILSPHARIWLFFHLVFTVLEYIMVVPCVYNFVPICLLSVGLQLTPPHPTYHSKWRNNIKILFFDIQRVSRHQLLFKPYCYDPHRYKLRRTILDLTCGGEV